MPVAVELPVADGQFDDAPEDQSPVPPLDTVNAADPREGHHYIDEELLEWSEDSEEGEEDEHELEEDDLEAAAYETLRAEDEDWERTERGMCLCAYRSLGRKE